MKRICFAFNHLQYSDGIARSVIGIANYLADNKDCRIVLRPIYRYDRSVNKLIDKRIKIKPVFGFFFHGMSKIVNRCPHTLLHNIIYGSQNYDIEVGFQHGTSTIAVSSYKKEDNDVKHYVWMHGYDVGLTMLPYFCKVDKIICVSKCNADKLYYDSDGKLKPDYAYNLIDEKKVCKDGQQPIDINRGQGLVFVSVGRQSEEKGYIRLINCLAKLKKYGYIFSLWLIGDGPDHQKLIEEARRLDVQDRIIFTGTQSNPHKYTSKADLFVCSSFSEGYSTACTEAIMLGVPVLSTNVSGAEEIMALAESGMIVENSEEALLNGLKEILDNPDLIEKWKTTLRNTKNYFSLEKRAEKLVNILEL